MLERVGDLEQAPLVLMARNNLETDRQSVRRVAAWHRDRRVADDGDVVAGLHPVDVGLHGDAVDLGGVRLIHVERRHLHPGGFVHGGVWTALGDTVAAWATFRNIPPGHNFTTIELKLNVFAAGILGDEIVAVGEPLHAGKSTVVVEVRMERRREGSEPRLAANLIVSQFVLPPT